MLNLIGLMWVKKEIREPPKSCKFPSETGARPEASDLKKWDEQGQTYAVEEPRVTRADGRARPGQTHLTPTKHS